MNRKERRAQKKNGALAMTPTAATLAQAFRAHQAGHRSDAERLYRDVLGVEPRNAAALHLLGALLHQSGRSDEGASLMRQAIAIEPRNPDYHYNLGCVLNATGRMEEAVESLSKAIALKPQYPEAHFELGNALARAGRLTEAETALERVVRAQPDNADAMNNLGRVIWDAGRREEAMSIWQRAAQRQPANALVQFNIASAEIEMGRPENAEAALRRALAAKRDYHQAKQRLAAVLLSLGKADEALLLASEAISASETNESRQTYIQCLMSASSFRPDSTVRERLRRALAECWFFPSDLAPLCASVLKAHPIIGPAITRTAGQWPQAAMAQQHPVLFEQEIAAADEPLLRTYLEATPNCDVEIERFLTALRANLLDRAVNGQAATASILNLCASLAHQCFLNEYVFNEFGSETTRAESLAATVLLSIRSGAPVSPFQLASLAMYRPLHSLANASRLLEQDWSAPLAEVLRRQIGEPMEEAALRGSTLKLTEVDGMSASERDHDEENPYPRWPNPVSTLTPLAIEDQLRRRLPPGDVPPLPRVPFPEVLVAGCGTGLRAISAGQSYLDANILAIDLSAASLAYARRQAARLKLVNIEFAQADILHLQAIDRRFDLIEAGGILNQLADPYAGWRVLNALLRPGGLMRIALYSEIACRGIVAAREFAAAGNYQSDLDGVRRCRQAILRLPAEAKARDALGSFDFYTASGFRDLVLHRQKHRMSLPDIADFLAANGLEFLSFEASDSVRRAFAQRFPEPAARKDLTAWHQFETERPETFAAMYVFWVLKPL
jgi:Tfp pilus assembly protein PilF/SAM-dependent methyltransferase